MKDQKLTPEQEAMHAKFTRMMEEAEVPELTKEELEAPANRRFWGPLTSKAAEEKS